MRKIEIEIPEERYELLQRLKYDGNVREVLIRLAYRASYNAEIVGDAIRPLTREQANALDWLREAALEIRTAR